MSFLISHQNKELLWGILAEEGIFDAIPSNVTLQELKHVFERILKNLLGERSGTPRRAVERTLPGKTTSHRRRRLRHRKTDSCKDYTNGYSSCAVRKTGTA